MTKDTTSIALLEDFIKQLGSTSYGSMARARLEELKKSQIVIVAPPTNLKQKPVQEAVAIPTGFTAASLRGRWRVTTSCYSGSDNLTFDIRETSATEFSGEYDGSYKIVRGRIDGNQILMTTQATFTVTSTGTVSRSGSSLQMQGSYSPGASLRGIAPSEQPSIGTSITVISTWAGGVTFTAACRNQNSPQ